MKKVIFEGDSLEVISNFSKIAKRRTGYEIDRVQRGLEPENWKPFSIIGKGVREIRVQVGQQYRIIYLAKFDEKVHVLHAFEKKSQKTSQSQVNTAKNRYKLVLRRYAK